jgi:hypothetical protein
MSTHVKSPKNNYLDDYDLYGPVRNAFDAGSIHYLGKLEVGGVWALEIESFLGPVKCIEPIGECHLGPKKLDLFDAKICNKILTYTVKWSNS